jgi:spore maturation protein CgeB
VLAEHFVPDQEVATFSNVEELFEKAHYYLRHPQLAQQIAQRGQARAYRDHTYERRLNELVSKVLPGKGWAPAPLPVPVKSVQLQMVGNA